LIAGRSHKEKITVGSSNQTVEIIMKKTILAAAVLAVSGSAFANGMTDKLYGVVGFQNSEADVDGLQEARDAGLSIDDNDSGFNLAIGFEVNESFAVEVGYMDMGKVLDASTPTLSVTAAGSGTLGGTPISWTNNLAGSLGANAEIDGWTLAGVFTLPINEKFDAYGKVGLYSWDATANVYGTITAGTLTVGSTNYGSGTHSIASASDDGTDPFYGVGLKYNISDKFAVRADYSRYEVYDEDIDVMGAALVVKF
jgi:OOP family OmpA-OmpF porin